MTIMSTRMLIDLPACRGLSEAGPCPLSACCDWLRGTGRVPVFHVGEDRMEIRAKRVYEPAEPLDGARFVTSQ